MHYTYKCNAHVNCSYEARLKFVKSEDSKYEIVCLCRGEHAKEVRPPQRGIDPYFIKFVDFECKRNVQPKTILQQITDNQSRWQSSNIVAPTAIQIKNRKKFFREIISANARDQLLSTAAGFNRRLNSASEVRQPLEEAVEIHSLDEYRAIEEQVIFTLGSVSYTYTNADDGEEISGTAFLYTTKSLLRNTVVLYQSSSAVDNFREIADVNINVPENQWATLVFGCRDMEPESSASSQNPVRPFAFALLSSPTSNVCLPRENNVVNEYLIGQTARHLRRFEGVDLKFCALTHDIPHHFLLVLLVQSGIPSPEPEVLSLDDLATIIESSELSPISTIAAAVGSTDDPSTASPPPPPETEEEDAEYIAAAAGATAASESAIPISSQKRGRNKKGPTKADKRRWAVKLNDFAYMPV